MNNMKNIIFLFDDLRFDCICKTNNPFGIYLNTILEIFQMMCIKIILKDLVINLVLIGNLYY